ARRSGFRWVAGPLDRSVRCPLRVLTPRLGGGEGVWPVGPDPSSSPRNSKTALTGRFARGIRGRWFARSIGRLSQAPLPLKGEKEEGALRRPLRGASRCDLRRLVAVDVLVDAAVVGAQGPSGHGDLVALVVGDDGRGAALVDVGVPRVRIRRRLARIRPGNRVTPVRPHAERRRPE